MSPRPFHAILPVLLITGIAAGQEKAEKPRKAPTPLKLQITLTRSQGEKKVTSAPYTLSFCADDRPARIRMGTKIPIQISKESPGQVSYQDVGNNIDCSAEALGDGRDQQRAAPALHQRSAVGAGWASPVRDGRIGGSASPGALTGAAISGSTGATKAARSSADSSSIVSGRTE